LIAKETSRQSVICQNIYALRENNLEEKLRKKGHVPMKYWPLEHKAMHEEFSDWVLESSEAKFRVICGSSNRGRYKTIKRGCFRTPTYLVTTKQNKTSAMYGRNLYHEFPTCVAEGEHGRVASGRKGLQRE